MAEGGVSQTTGRGSYRYLCGTPPDRCSGSVGNLSNSFKSRGLRVHVSSAAAFACHRQHLLGLGYTQVDARSFAPPGGGPIRVLTKKSRFGAKMRPGKGGRNMPNRPRTGGTVTSS